MSLDASLRTELEKFLSDSEIEAFASGDAALYIKHPTYRFYRIADDEYQIANVVRDMSPENDADMRIYHDVSRTSIEKVKENVEMQSDVNDSDITTVPVEIGFDDL